MSCQDREEEGREREQMKKRKDGMIQTGSGRHLSGEHVCHWIRSHTLSCGFVILTTFLPGCASQWARNRRADLTDAFAVSMTGYSLGAQANVGPMGIGLLVFGHHGSGSYDLGFGGLASTSRNGLVVEAGIPLSLGSLSPTEERAGATESQKTPCYRRRFPSMGSIGFEVGLGVGIAVRFDVVEAADFLIGLVGLDLVGDDLAKVDSKKKLQ